MSDIAIRAEHLSKRYVIGAHRRRFDTIGEILAHITDRKSMIQHQSVDELMNQRGVRQASSGA